MSIESRENYIVTEREARGYYAFPRDSIYRLDNAIEVST